MNAPILYDVTLRDGSNANNQCFTSHFYSSYIDKAYAAGLREIEVGHGYGLGGDSLHIARLQDGGIWEVVSDKITQYPDLRFGVHLIPGLATFEDIDTAVDLGISIFRVATHCTEADLARTYIQHVSSKGLQPWGLLMMCHMGDPDVLIKEAQKLESFGARHVVFMDSAGSLTPSVVQHISELLVAKLNVPVGFHAHNNLSAAVANSLVALAAGCQTLDTSVCGYGPGSGNLPLESFVSILQRDGWVTPFHVNEILALAAFVEGELAPSMPRTNSISTATGFYGLFSGFKPRILEAASVYGIDAFQLIEVLGQQQVIAGQEDQIIAMAQVMAQSSHSSDRR